MEEVKEKWKVCEPAPLLDYTSWKRADKVSSVQDTD